LELIEIFVKQLVVGLEIELMKQRKLYRVIANIGDILDEKDASREGQTREARPLGTRYGQENEHAR